MILQSDETINIDDFVENQLRDYAVYDNARSLPSVVDGLKTSHRKILHTVFETLKVGVEIKTTNLGASASNLTHYAHGEDSIIDAVITMAQDFAGSNNWPLLQKEGQFGTAINNEASSPRYIFVKRTNLLDVMFDPEDRDILEYQQYDGYPIEPTFFLPKLPLLAINGSKGIGNGYSCKILPRSLESVRAFIKSLLAGQTPDTLLPSYNGFKGTVERLGERSFSIIGKFERVNMTTTIITDLPPDSAYQYERYKVSTLLPLLTRKDSGLVEFENESEEGNWRIILKHTREFGKKTDDQIRKELNLIKKDSDNISVWGFDEKLKKFNNIEDMIVYWYENRLVYIEQRKQSMLFKYGVQLSWLSDLRTLIKYWLVHPEILKLKRQPIIDELLTVVTNKEHIQRFLSQDILSLTEERIEKIESDFQALSDKVEVLRSKTKEVILGEDVDSIFA